MSLDDVNDLQGKAKNKTDQAYFMINPEDLKYTYIEHLSAVTINTEVKKTPRQITKVCKNRKREKRTDA